jgi:hypothetical protein
MEIDYIEERIRFENEVRVYGWLEDDEISPEEAAFMVGYIDE